MSVSDSTTCDAGHKCCWCNAMPGQRHKNRCAESRRLYLAGDLRWTHITTRWRPR